MIIECHFHINGFTLNLALKQTLGATWKWLICERSYSYLQTQAAKFDITGYKVLMTATWIQIKYLPVTSKVYEYVMDVDVLTK